MKIIMGVIGVILTIINLAMFVKSLCDKKDNVFVIGYLALQTSLDFVLSMLLLNS
jgi:heme/copper-type cytochrome/quinol oxidase subunit 4